MVTAPWSELLAPPRILNRARPRQAESTCGLAEEPGPHLGSSDLSSKVPVT